MVLLRIEHPVPDYDGWKRAFDSDPVGRQQSGVRRYRISRPIDDPHYVTIDLELDTVAEAESLLASLQILWNRVEGQVMTGPRSRILELLEVQAY
ncbi:MAG: hypothetical protein ACE15D_15150 [Candidatus Eisenbacteria bacterium]